MGERSTVEAGREAEARARAHLERLGYRIVAANWRCRLGELDLVALDGPTLCIVEVRSRAGTGFGHPFETVGGSKRARLRRAATAYLQRFPHAGPVRFDVVAVVGDAIELCRAAFE